MVASSRYLLDNAAAETEQRFASLYHPAPGGTRCSGRLAMLGSGRRQRLDRPLAGQGGDGPQRADDAAVAGPVGTHR